MKIQKHWLVITQNARQSQYPLNKRDRERKIMGEQIKAISFTCILMITMQVVQIAICLALHKAYLSVIMSL